MRWKPLLALCALTLIAACVGCRKPSAENGEALFRKDCAGCHVQRAALKNAAPSLAGYFNRKPRPSERQARQIIQEGKGYMPPFGRRLNSDEIDDLIAYLKTGSQSH